MSQPKLERIGILGGGLIGSSWAMIFASVGYQVQIYGISPEQNTKTIDHIATELKRLEQINALRGSLTADQQNQCITGTNDLKELVKNSIFLLECVPENVNVKRNVFKQLDDAIESDQVILASSTGTFLPSQLSADMKHKSQVIVTHPINPPYYVPVVEIVPSPWTNPEICEKTTEIMLNIGQKPIRLNREIEGFAANRIEYAILNEVWRLFADGILNVRDIDAVMSHGLGMRYAFLGQLEVSSLNAEGFVSSCERYGKVIYDVSQTFGPIPRMTGSMANEISKQLEEMSPLNKLEEKRKWRDECLMHLAALKKKH